MFFGHSNFTQTRKPLEFPCCHGAQPPQTEWASTTKTFRPAFSKDKKHPPVSPKETISQIPSKKNFVKVRSCIVKFTITNIFWDVKWYSRLTFQCYLATLQYMGSSANLFWPFPVPLRKQDHQAQHLTNAERSQISKHPYNEGTKTGNECHRMFEKNILLKFIEESKDTTCNNS